MFLLVIHGILDFCQGLMKNWGGKRESRDSSEFTRLLSLVEAHYYVNTIDCEICATGSSTQITSDMENRELVNYTIQ